MINSENFDKSDFNQQNNQQFVKPEYAGFWIRYCAMVIDSVVFTPISILIVIILRSHIEFMFLFFGLWTYFYFIHLPASKYQATFGKMALRIYVGNKDSNRISLIRSIARFLFANVLIELSLPIIFLSPFIIYAISVKNPEFEIISIFIILVVLPIILITNLLRVVLTKEKTALHDLICGTRVFYGRKYRKFGL